MTAPANPQLDHETLRRLEAAMLKLRRIDREILLAHRLDAMSYGEIALRTGLSPRQVERSMARALYEIDRALGDDRLPWWRRWL